MGVSNYLPSSRLIQPGVCTSSTRPASPYEGMVIYETDTDRTMIWNGSSWVLQHSAGSYSATSASVYPNFLVYFTGANGSAVNNATAAYNTALYDDTSSVSNGVFTVPSGHAGVYQFNCAGNVYNIGGSGYFYMMIITTGSSGHAVHGSQTPAQNSTDVFSVASMMVKLAVGDTVYCRFVVPATGNYSAGASWNTFSGARIR